MLIQERFNQGTRELIKTYSDSGVYIKQIETNNEYIEAIDIYPLRYHYEETNRLIEIEGQEEQNV